MPVGLNTVPPLTTSGRQGVFYDNGDSGYFSRGFIFERVTVSASAAQKALTNKLPANSRVVGCAVRCIAAGTFTTGTHLSIGISSGDFDAFMAAVAIANVKDLGDVWFGNNPAAAANTTDVVSAETTIALGATNSSGATSGTIDSGTWDVVIVFEQFSGFNASA